MNRLAFDTEIHAPSTSTVFENLHETGTLQRRRTNRLGEVPWATFAPMHYEPRYAYPLVVWLHGTASNEHELREVMPRVSMRNYVAVAPRGTWVDPRRQDCYGWRQTPETIEAAEGRIADCLSLAQQRFNIHSKRVFLVGYGSGGTMALRVAWNDPASFAGVVTINGALPACLTPLRKVKELRRLPCFLATSRKSRIYPPNRVCRDLRLLHSAGCTVALRQYPGGGGLGRKILRDLDRWLMDLVCGGDS